MEFRQHSVRNISASHLLRFPSFLLLRLGVDFAVLVVAVAQVEAFRAFDVIRSVTGALLGVLRAAADAVVDYHRPPNSMNVSAIHSPNAMKRMNATTSTMSSMCARIIALALRLSTSVLYHTCTRLCTSSRTSTTEFSPPDRSRRNSQSTYRCQSCLCFSCLFLPTQRPKSPRSIVPCYRNDTLLSRSSVCRPTGYDDRLMNGVLIPQFLFSYFFL